MTEALVAEDIARLVDRYAEGTIGGAGELRTQISRAISGLPRLGR